MKNKSRTLSTRRDRRKAKASNWARPGRKTSGKVAHGGPGQDIAKVTPFTGKAKQAKADKPPPTPASEPLIPRGHPLRTWAATAKEPA